MTRMSRACVMLWLAYAVLGDSQPSKVESQTRPFNPTHREAYVTLLYGEQFLLGVRVLGQSLRETGTERDLVVIGTPDLSQYATDTLEGEGWKVKKVDAVMNPSMRNDGKYPARFYAVYTKLNVFNLVEYSKVVFLDADTVVVHNMDEIFRCPGFCATLRHSERFNSGVMAITPDGAVFEDIMNSIAELPSYTGGDQGFLNAYFKGFIDGPLFDPEADYSEAPPRFMRLPTRYNADIGLYVFNSNRWQLDGRLKVIHYTLGSFKPWDWWCGWLIEEQARWNKFRMRLGPDAHGHRHGITGPQAFAQNWLILVPLAALMLVARFVVAGWPKPLVGAVLYFPKWYQPRGPSSVVSIVAGYMCIGASLFFTAYIIPAAVTPSWGWILAYEYTFTFIVLLFGKYLHICLQAGEAAALAAGQSRPRGNLTGAKDANLPWLNTLTLGGLLSALMLVTPFLNTVLQVPGFVPKILLTVLGALLTNTVATHVFATLGTQWFQAGAGATAPAAPTK